MEGPEYDRMFMLEDRHWWFVARRQLAWRCLENLELDEPVVDLGCGTGSFATEAQNRFRRVVGLDVSRRALSLARRRRLRHLVQAEGTRLPFANNRIGLLIALDFLEHVEDDRAALREVCRVLRPGGHALFTVPANPKLWSPHDTALHHHRRYTAPELRQKLQEAGLVIERFTHAMALLYPFIYLYRRMVPRTADREGADVRPTHPGLNRFLSGLMRIENRWLREKNLRFGVSLLARVQKPPETPAR